MSEPSAAWARYSQVQEDLTLPLEQVAEGYKAMDERHAIKPCSRRDPPWAAVSPSTRRPDNPTIDPPGPAGR